MATILGQRCTVFLDPDSIQRFKIESSIDSVLPGDLPIYGSAPYTSNIFVHQIVTPTDPKADKFLRVGNIADLTTLALGRETALGAGQTIYLSADFSVIYDDIATATQAKTLIQQRVDNLIADWHTYNDTFLAPETVSPPNHRSDITLPLTASLEAERKDAYNTAHAELLAAKTDSATAGAAYSAATDGASAANEVATAAVAESQQCSTLLGQFNSGTAAVDDFRTAMNSLVTASQTFDAACVVYNAAVAVYRAIDNPNGTQEGVLDTATSAFNSARSTWLGFVSSASTASQAEALAGAPILTALHTSMSGSCTSKIADVAIAAAAKTEADLAAAVATTEKKAADEAESAALIADTEAYLSVKELCPDFERTVP